MPASRVWQDSCNYLYFPRLQNEHVFREALELGMQSREYFGTAAGKIDDEYAGFSFGRGGSAVLDDAFIIIEKSAAGAWQEKIFQNSGNAGNNTMDHGNPANPDSNGIADGGKSSGFNTGGGDGSSESGHGLGYDPGAGKMAGQDGEGPPLPASDMKRQFYGSVDLIPVTAKMDFATIVDEVVQQFTTRLGVDVSISVEVRASSASSDDKAVSGFDENLQRAVKENCSVLKFNSAEFE